MTAFRVHGILCYAFPSIREIEIKSAAERLVGFFYMTFEAVIAKYLYKCYSIALVCFGRPVTGVA